MNANAKDEDRYDDIGYLSFLKTVLLQKGSRKKI